jgi:hypothetical protein
VYIIYNIYLFLDKSELWFAFALRLHMDMRIFKLGKLHICAFRSEMEAKNRRRAYSSLLFLLPYTFVHKRKPNKQGRI